MMKRYIISLTAACIFLLVPAFQAAGQNGIDSKVEVTRDFEGKVAKAEKSRLDTRIEDSLYNFKLNFDYATFYRPYSDLYEFFPQHTAAPFSDGKVRNPWFYARLGVSYPLMPVADIYVAPYSGRKFSFLFYLNHDSYWGRLPHMEQGTVYAGDVKGDNMTNRAGASFSFRWTTGEVLADVAYSNRYYTYREASYPDNASYHDYDNLKAAVKVRSTNPDRNSFYYDVDFSYRYFGDRQHFRSFVPVTGGYGVTEHVAGLDASFGATFKSYHRIYLRAFSTSSMYNESASAASLQHTGTWGLTPTYKWEKDRWRIGAGVAFSALFGSSKGELPSPRMAFYPDVKVEFEAVRNAFWLYMKATGDHKVYTHYDIALMNPWFDNQGHVLASYTPISAEAGFRGVVKDRFSYGLRANYSYVGNMLSFFSNGMYQYPQLADNQILTAGATLRWKSKDFYALAEFDYRYMSDPHAALMTPAFDLKAELEYNIRSRVFFNLNCYFRTSTVGAEMTSAAGNEVLNYYTVPAFADLGFRITWAINPVWSVYVEGNNLANARIQYFLNYVEPGIGGGAGVYLKF